MSSLDEHLMFLEQMSRINIVKIENKNKMSVTHNFGPANGTSWNEKSTICTATLNNKNTFAHK